MEQLWNLLRQLNAWSNGAYWRTWLMHAVIAVPLTLLFGAFATVVFYCLRELEQIAHEKMKNLPIFWADHFMDVVSPFLAALLTALIF